MDSWMQSSELTVNLGLSTIGACEASKPLTYGGYKTANHIADLGGFFLYP